MKAVIYARTSSSGNLEHIQDTTRQVSDLSEYCRFMKYEFVKTFEEHLTAKNGTARTVFNECIDYCKQNHIDTHVTSELSRINRGSVFDTMNFIKELRDSGINLYPQKNNSLYSVTMGEQAYSLRFSLVAYPSPTPWNWKALNSDSNQEESKPRSVESRGEER